MRRQLLTISSLLVLGTGTARAGTFDSTPIAPAQGVEVLTERVAREQLGRSVFANPYGAVTLGTVDVYDVFPYLESRHFQFVSDPEWNRLVYGEAGKSLRAYDGSGTALGPLAKPRGLAADEFNRLYVADSGNDRIVVLQASTEYDAVSLTPLYAIDGLGEPFGVAVSDRGTPYDPSDDVLFVADTGKNRIVAFSLGGVQATQVAEIGELGSGPGRFAGPTAIAVGRSDGASNDELYVADAHNVRIVRLAHASGRLHWIGEAAHEAGVLTSLDTDRWGNVYAAAPQSDAVYKYSPTLTPVARLTDDLLRPKSFHVPFVNVVDHRDGTVVRAGQPSGLLVESWSDANGLRLWKLGLEVADLAVIDDGGPLSRFTLTDRADVSLEIRDGATGPVLAQRTIGALDAGLHEVRLSDEEIALAAGGERTLRLTARSGYESGPSDVAETDFTVNGSSVVPPGQARLLGNSPNPALSHTRIAFLLPSTSREPAVLTIYDVRGRRVRTLGGNFTPGLNEVEWNGRDERGNQVAAGVYFYRLRVDEQVLTRQLVFVR